MNIFSKLAGTIATFFQIGGAGGPGWNANGSAIEGKNAANSALTVVRGATPVGANDLATKAYVDAGGAAGAIAEIRFALGTGAAQSSVTQLPANAYVVSATLEITTPYSAGTTISVGQTGSPNLLMLTTDNVATLANAYTVPQDTSWGASAATVLVTIAGSPSAGVGVCIVQYTETLP